VVAPSTAHEFVEKAKRKLRTRSRVEMVAVAASLGIIEPASIRSGFLGKTSGAAFLHG
jgi:hypothetical protein